MTTLTLADCIKRTPHKNRFLVDNESLCASSPKGHGACFNDVGGPLVSNGQLIGLGTYPGGGVSCGNEFPDGFVRISSFLTWIKQVSGVVAV